MRHRARRISRANSAVADGVQSVILQQVTYGIAVRMAVMAMILGNQALAGAA